jgi:hypothetical protein
VLVAGGYTYTHPGNDWGGYTRSAEIYDPSTSSFTSLTAKLNTARREAAVAPLPGGQVLIAGGGYVEQMEPSDSAEIFDPVTGDFTLTGSMSTGRRDLFAAPLPDGRVIVGGGRNFPRDSEGHEVAHSLSSTEFYSPISGAFTPGPPLPYPVQLAVATSLPDGRVLIVGARTTAGSSGDSFDWTRQALLFNPYTELFEAGPETPFDSARAAVTLDDGWVLIIAAEEVWEYDPGQEAFADTGIDSAAYWSAGAAPLQGSRALIVGHETSGFDEAQKQAWVFRDAPHQPSTQPSGGAGQGAAQPGPEDAAGPGSAPAAAPAPPGKAKRHCRRKASVKGGVKRVGGARCAPKHRRRVRSH